MVMNSVFVNRTLNMRTIKAIGFDMDHTLINYKAKKFEEETYLSILKNLVTNKNYPKSILKLKFNHNKIIRGLVIDKKTGMFVKLSRYRSVRDIFHGEERIHYKDRRKYYSTDYIDFSVHHPRFKFIESHFLISLGLAFMQLVELKKKGVKLPKTDQLFKDVSDALDQTHIDKIVKNKVIKEPKKYILSQPKVAQGLEKLVQHNKKLFLITNSSPEYCIHLMEYAIQPFLKQNTHWTDLFEFIVTDSNKPAFFYNKEKFTKINKKTFKSISSTTTPTPGFYKKGCAFYLTRSLKVKEYEILYIGDQVYTDVVLLKQQCGWRTALVIEELKREVEIYSENREIYKDIKKYMKQKKPIEQKIDKLISEKIENSKSNNAEIKKLLKKVEQLDQALSGCILKSNSKFNKNWGELMRVGVEESLFASQAERFSCIYMTHILDFLSQSSRSYFRASKRLLPHEIKNN